MQDNSVFADTQIVDVSDESQTRAGFAASLAALGDIDGIVANAGVNGPTKPLWDYSLDEWQSVMSVDLTGVFLSVQARHLIICVRANGDASSSFPQSPARRAIQAPCPMVRQRQA